MRRTAFRRGKKKHRKIKHINLKSWRKKAWDLHSEYVRRSEHGICFTCGRSDHWKKMDAGHYIHKDCLDFDPMNIHCQCTFCNRYKHGNLGVYAERLIAKYGEHAVAELRERANKGKKFNIFELETLINDYTNKLAELKQESEPTQC